MAPAMSEGTAYRRPFGALALIVAAACSRAEFIDHTTAGDLLASVEAEAGAVTPSMSVVEDGDANGGAYVIDGNPPGSAGAGTLELEIDLDAAPDDLEYDVFCRTLA